MTDIVISYARETEAEAQRVAEALRGLGYEVWRDDEIPAHRAFGEAIEERLAATKVVLVLWSAEAAKSDWVRSEASRARAMGKLVQLTLDRGPGGAREPSPVLAALCFEFHRRDLAVAGQPRAVPRRHRPGGGRDPLRRCRRHATFGRIWSVSRENDSWLRGAQSR